MTSANPFDSDEAAIYNVQTSAAGPSGSLPFSESMLRDRPSGDLFGWSQNAGMGWNPSLLGGDEFLILSTMGGLRDPDGKPIALGYHTGHWEVGLLVDAAARELSRQGCVPFAGHCSDPCDGRSQGTSGMFDSLPYRNDAAVILRRLIRSLPTRKGVIGVATCDKGHPAMMMALAGCADLPCILVPGGVTLPPTHGEDAAKIQSIGARFSHGTLTLREAAELGCRACATPGGGCQFLGTAATSQVVGEALGLSLPHSALAPSGQPIWLDLAKRSAHAVVNMASSGLRLRDILTDAAVRNAMVVHAAFGGSTNLLLHLPAVAHAAGLRRPNVQDWIEVNGRTPRLVSALPNGPFDHPTVRVFLAGGVPEVMLHLRELGLLELDALTASGISLGASLDAWASSDRRSQLRKMLQERDGVDPNEVIFSPSGAAEYGLSRTLIFPVGNIAPEGSVVKSTSIEPSLIVDGVYHHLGQARIFATEASAMQAIKAKGKHAIKPGDVMVLAGCGPAGTGMEETYQLTAALKHLEWGKHVPLLTDARFSGVSTGACIGHIGPEALVGGPIGKLRNADLIEISLNLVSGTGSVNLVGHGDQTNGVTWGDAQFAGRTILDDLKPAQELPEDTRLWAALQQLSGGTWGGCVYDVDAILEKLE